MMKMIKNDDDVKKLRKIVQDKSPVLVPCAPCQSVPNICIFVASGKKKTDARLLHPRGGHSVGTIANQSIARRAWRNAECFEAGL